MSQDARHKIGPARPRRALALVALLPFVCVAPVRAADPPQRIMSMMQCNDLLLLALVPKQRIASVTYLAHEAVAAIMTGADRGVAINHGTAEEIVRQRPDLILAGTYSTPAARRLAKKIGARLVEIPAVNSFQDIRQVTRQIGALVGEPAKAEAMIARMDAILADLAAHKPKRIVTVAAWSGSGSVPGKGTLIDEMIRVAGGTNVAARFQDANYSSFGIEELIAARPDAIIESRNEWTAPSLRSKVGGHPLVRRLYARRTITYPAPVVSCGLPQTAESVRALHRAFAALPQGGVGW
ncbi:ABC transporter substrate-binding protein [Sphingomonas sp. MMS24-J13]|uniref:ABC transporter substrate-binding protein n=1 Tax=Sphingomonas sp. MMS24-J13 TaxID=3238686 RepID=UPI00385023F9